MTADPDAYCYGRKLLDRVGWEMFLGDDGHGGERWEPITGVRIAGDRVLITVADGTTYATGYSDAVRCRKPHRLVLMMGSEAVAPARLRAVAAHVGCDATRTRVTDSRRSRARS